MTVLLSAYLNYAWRFYAFRFCAVSRVIAVCSSSAASFSAHSYAPSLLAGLQASSWRPLAGWQASSRVWPPEGGQFPRFRPSAVRGTGARASLHFRRAFLDGFEAIFIAKECFELVKAWPIDWANSRPSESTSIQAFCPIFAAFRARPLLYVRLPRA